MSAAGNMAGKTAVRVYLAATRAELEAVSSGGSLPASLRAHAVTAALREAWPDGDDEQWEYAALMAAAADARDRIAGAGVGRRLVLAADLPVEEVASDGEPTSVHTAVELRWRQVSAILVDPVDDADDDDDLAWFATQEAADVLASWR